MVMLTGLQAMFEILEADIVVMQETKIQRKDLQDDMVLVPGWDVIIDSFHLEGYSGVAIYTRNAVCAPIRAEEGITGILTPPNSTTSFRDLPQDQQIGGYPLGSQLCDCALDAATLDSEGRCVVLEFPAFVLIGTYCPANRDETRDEFRIGFLTALDARVRNLIAQGKRVFLTGDLNIIRDELDTAKAEEQLRRQGITSEQYLSTPARRMLNQLVVDGKVIGERDEGRERAVMWDICRSFHPKRQGMFTCWEQKINARPGNFGSRIDYILCSVDMHDWFSESNIQEGLMGSDHCPVYAVFKDKVEVNGHEVYIKDLMSNGMFQGGIKKREWSIKDLLPMSAKLIPEFDRRRSIRDMFTKKPSLSTKEGSLSMSDIDSQGQEKESKLLPETGLYKEQSSLASILKLLSPVKSKRPMEMNGTGRPQKRGKSGNSTKSATNGKTQQGKGQSSLMGFFKPKTPQTNDQGGSEASSLSEAYQPSDNATPVETSSEFAVPESLLPESAAKNQENSTPSKKFNPADQKSVVDPIAAKESWSKLLGKRVVPRCEHNEPCVSMLTKKPGVNCVIGLVMALEGPALGRAQPLGSGSREFLCMKTRTDDRDIN
ncbi:hypothetical protein G7Y89_g2485 [Cudoniella acicularis]|uniref:Endonuclease/exonuclease/phosphatase domain-containing protein n=1 Tax=Cudoniella acicularis TaxID=354080 RepID=A0A8H4W6X1_9HELO|nr:hypothetical protein G7Y89_g2485 [Cudoniella acicularis]